MTTSKSLAAPFSAVSLSAVLGLALLTAGCPPTDGPPADAGPDPLPDPASFCPGGSGCASSDGELLAGAAKRAFTPTAFEVANPAYLKHDRPDACEPDLPAPGATRCGELRLSVILDDCGKDGVCAGDDNYVAPDDDGTEGDGVTDYFLDCGRDRLCPGDDGYTAPDADGSEGDEIFQGLWIAGYGNNRPAMGVKDDLWARTVVLRTGDTTVAMTTVDAVGLFYDEVVRIRERVEAARPGEVDLVIVQSTHTHEAPDTMGQWGLEDPYAGLQLGHGRSDAMMEDLRAAATDSIVAALDQLEAATVSVGTLDTRQEGLVHDGRDPQIFHHLMTVVRVAASDDDATIATLVNWGNHPEILDSRNNYISSDYAHALRVALEEGLPAAGGFPARTGLGGVAIYQQGAVGGIMGPNGFELTGRDGTLYENRYKTFARCDAYGELLADQAFTALEGATAIDAPALRFSAQPFSPLVENQVFHVGFFNGWFDRELVAFDPDLPLEEGNLPSVNTEAALVYLGPIAWLTAPGEMFPETFVGFAEQLRGDPVIDPENPNPPDLAAAPAGPHLFERTSAEYPILLGLALDEIGYLVPPYDFELHPTAPWIDEAEGDHYEETNSVGVNAVPSLMGVYDVLFTFEHGR